MTQIVTSFFLGMYIIGVIVLVPKCRWLALMWPVTAAAQLIDAVEEEVIATRNSRRG